MIVLVGMDWRQMENKLDLDRVVFQPWVDFEAYPWMMKSLCADIGIAPVSFTSFNDCRSSIKWVEHSALKIATVASDYGPYKRDMVNGKTGLLCKTHADWNKALTMLIEKEDYRRKLADNAYRHCKFNFNLDFIVDKWMNVLEEVNK